MAGVGDEQLSKLHVRCVAHPARDRDRGDSKSPQGDWLPDGVSRHSHARAKFGDRNRGLLGPLVSREPLGRRLTPYACVEHLASHRRLADEGAGSTWKKANLSGPLPLLLRACLVKVRVRIVLYALSNEKAVSHQG